MSGKRLGKFACMNCSRHSVSSSGAPDGPDKFCGLDELGSEAAADRMNEENGFAAIELREKFVEGRIGDASPKDKRPGCYAHHAEFIEGAARFGDRRLHVRERGAGEGGEALRRFAHDARINIVAEPRRVHRIVFLREIRELAGDGKNLHVHIGTVHFAEVRIEAAEVRGIQLHFPN